MALCDPLKKDSALSFALKKQVLPWTNRSISTRKEACSSKAKQSMDPDLLIALIDPTTQAGISRRGQRYFKGKKEKSFGHPGLLTFCSRGQSLAAGEGFPPLHLWLRSDWSKFTNVPLRLILAHKYAASQKTSEFLLQAYEFYRGACWTLSTSINRSLY